MSLHHEMQAAADEYARRLEATAEGERLAALAAEARHAAPAMAASFLGALFADLDAQVDPDSLGNPAEDTSDTHPQEMN